MSQAEVRRIPRDGNPKKDRRFDKRDWNQISEYILDTHRRRKREREPHDKIWDDIDRQLAMDPDVTHKMNADGTLDFNKRWMPELELPLQAQTLEVLTADARRMLFPDAGPWFAVHSGLTDKYLDRVDLQGLVMGDETEVPTQITQDGVDKMVRGVIENWHRQYDFYGNIDQINAEAFKYGLGIGRARMVSKRMFLPTAKGVMKIDTKMPVLVPVSVRNTYVDDSEHRLMNEGHIIGPSTTREWRQLWSDLTMAASRGSTDPENENGGWMPRNLGNLEPDKDGCVTLIEMEGDFIVHRRATDNIYIPNAICTVVCGQHNKKPSQQVVRFRYRDQPYSSYVFFPYHHEHIDRPYPSSPLMKGHPIQSAAVDAMTRLIEAAALNTQPPIAYDRDDTEFASFGGPRVIPGATWATTGEVTPIYIGDPSALFQIYSGLLQQYADVTGINAPRLGAQTLSHTTAYAKEAELQRGTIRTVDYTRSALKGPLTQWLYMAYDMGRSTVREQPVFIEAYNGWVELSAKHLPEQVSFEAHGSGGPQEEQAKRQERVQAFQMALQVDQMNVQMGGQPKLDLAAMIEQIMLNGGWTDVDQFLNANPAEQAAAGVGPQAGGQASPGILTQGPRGNA